MWCPLFRIYRSVTPLCRKIYVNRSNFFGKGLLWVFFCMFRRCKMGQIHSFLESQVWVKIFGLSQKYWRLKILFVIASTVGTQTCTDST